MMKNFFKEQKGINLISLSVAVIVILILTNIIIYNVKDNLGIQRLKSMQTDIQNLRDKVSSYYATYGTIPANKEIEYTNTGKIESAGVVSTAVDTGKFYVIDLAAIENVTLIYGKDYEKIRTGEATTADDINSLEDLYVINEDSHNIFYIKGVTVEEENFYTDYTKEDIDTKAVELIEVDRSKENWSPTYDKTVTYKDKNEEIATIPEGFEVSRKEGEDTINSGLVVKGEDGSEFVWVPVSDINNMAQCSTAGGDCKLELDDDGHLTCTTHDSTQIVGKLYATEVEENFGTVNTTYDADSGLREPAIISSYDNDTENYNTVGLTLEGLKNEYKTMAESVAKNGGFYIGRYETSLSSATESSAGTSGTVQSKAGVIPTGAGNDVTFTWYGLYDKSKSYTISQDSVQSSMIWGSQYDAMFNWAKNGADSSKIKAAIGNNKSGTVATTGNSSYANDSINNVRDLGGNLEEWTLEAGDDWGRTIRGDCYSKYGNRGYSPSYRFFEDPCVCSDLYGTRLTLYMK